MIDLIIIHEGYFSSIDRERCRMGLVVSHGEWILGFLFRLRTKFKVLTYHTWFFVAIWSLGTPVNSIAKKSTYYLGCTFYMFEGA